MMVEFSAHERVGDGIVAVRMRTESVSADGSAASTQCEMLNPVQFAVGMGPSMRRSPLGKELSGEKTTVRAGRAAVTNIFGWGAP